VSVRSENLLPRAQAFIQRAAHLHVRDRAELLSSIAKDIHRTAPRGGKNTNYFGEQRSAPYEPPAMEFGTLFSWIDQEVTVEGLRATVIVNRLHLEFTLRRPLGDMAAHDFRVRVRSTPPKRRR
jgi:hypothetical protein